MTRGASAIEAGIGATDDSAARCVNWNRFQWRERSAPGAAKVAVGPGGLSGPAVEPTSSRSGRLLEVAMLRRYAVEGKHTPQEQGVTPPGQIVPSQWRSPSEGE